MEYSFKDDTKRFVHGQLERWLVAYWCLYHAGVASWLSEQEGPEFWKQLLIAAANEQPAPTGQRWPRSSERRHWRGAQAVRSATELAERWEDPKDFIEYLRVWNAEDDGLDADADMPFKVIASRVKENRGFGDWMAFKVADMMDYLLFPVNFTQSEVFMYRDPVKGALMVWRRHNDLPETAKPKDQNEVIKAVVEHLIEEFKDLSVMPVYDNPSLNRSVGLQEVETVLCKFKSHINGHYPLWHDIDEINEGLQPWLEHSATARTFLLAMPRRSKDE